MFLKGLGSYTLHFGLKYEIIYQLHAIEYLFVYFQLDMFRTLHAHLQEQWMLQFLYICSVWCSWCSKASVLRSATRHQQTHSSRPTPNYTKDTICCICKEIATSIAPEDGRISPKHVELKEPK